MNRIRTSVWRRGLAAGLAVVVLLSACAGPQQRAPRQPVAITLLGVVVDGARPAGDREAGLVRVWRDGRWLEGQPGLVLMRGDFVETGPRADAVIRFPNGSTLYMRPDSRGRIGSLSEAVGEFFARIKGVFSIETSFVRAAANGTEFAVRAQPDGEADVTVIEGSVYVDSTRGSWQRILVGAGQSIVAQARAAPVTVADEREIRRNRDWADRLDRLLPSTGAAGNDSGRSVGGALAIGAAIAAAAALLSGRDKDDRDKPHGNEPARPSDSSRLAAPSARGVGSADAGRAPALDCNRRVSLSWGAVAGARDYLITLQVRDSMRSPWTHISTEPTTRQRIDVAAQPARSHRWSVQARSGSRIGASSDTLYFDCHASVR